MNFDKQKFLKEKDVDIFIIKNLSNIFRYSNKKVSFGYIILTEKDDWFIVDSRYIDLIKNWGGKYLNINEIGGLFKFLNNMSFDKVGIESDSWSIYEYEKLYSFVKGKEIKKIYKPFDKYRAVKTKSQIEKIKKSIYIINEVYNKIHKNFSNGRYINKSEMEVRKDIVNYIFEFGGDGESFETIVAFGIGTSIPHRKTSHDNKLNYNMPVLIDMGSIFQGWCSDFTRSFWYGDVIDSEWQKIYDVVRKAYDEAWKTAIPGNKFKDVDLAARRVIDDAGFGKFFTHATGHGIGIDVHEYPTIYKNSDDIIKPGMVFTIEPGIYLPGKFGVRWESIKIIE